ncbi:MAG: hypothetical protein HY363_00995 [Candidatus Aenigmarchaeota archaeon]|nr:hypothetical protein [Candidatus Aenigmarchaeota archaeon]
MLLSFIIFFLIITLLGFPFSQYLKFYSRAEKYVLTRGIGLGVFPLLTIILNTLSIPLHYITYIIIGAAATGITFYFSAGKKEKFESKEYIETIIAAVLALIVFAVFVYGAARYAYLEDDDPWFHAMGSKYVAQQKTYSLQHDEEIWLRSYLEPYPPSYDVLMGVLHQTNNSMQFTLKIFNALLVALSHLFFYFFARIFLQSRKLALFASAILLLNPSYAGHFIWAQSLNIALMFPALLAVYYSGTSLLWTFIAVVMLAGINLTQLSSAVAINAMSGLLALSQKNWRMVAGIFIAAVVAAGVFYVPMVAKYGWAVVKEGNSVFPHTFTFGVSESVQSDTSGGKIYGITDFISVPLVTRIDQPTGLGIGIFILGFSGFFLLLYFRKKITPCWGVILLWFAFTLVGLEGNLLPVRLFPHRFWPFFAVPVALLSALLLRIISGKKRLAFVAVVLIAVIVTSGVPKFIVQTSPWQPGGSWASKNEIQGYLQLQKILPKNTPIMTLCTDRDEVIGLDFAGLPLDYSLERLRRRFNNLTVAEIQQFMRQKNMRYVIIDNHCVKKYGKQQTEKLMSAVQKVFKLEYETSGMHLFSIG